jgi:hypothetical protein
MAAQEVTAGGVVGRVGSGVGLPRVMDWGIGLRVPNSRIVRIQRRRVGGIVRGVGVVVKGGLKGMNQGLRGLLDSFVQL